MEPQMNARSGQLHPAVAPERLMDKNMISFAPDDGAALRSAFGRFGTGVTVITTQTDEGPIGMTANSFSSVSLDPALVLWSAALRSKRHDAFANTAHFCIHVLAADQQDVAYHFASQGHDFSKFGWLEGPNGAPALNGVLAQFHCDTFAVHPAGDHSLIIGQVTHASERTGEGAGLMFDQGRFGTFTPIDPA
jgi:flavin reductase (DIM6/NTAB) family NADH-FMN oxidoreductase RutF